MARSALWCALAAAALATATRLGRVFGLGYASAEGPNWLLLAAWAASLGVAVLATGRLLKGGAYVFLLPLAALGLALAEPGRAGDPRTWRLEWGVFGLVWTTVGVVLFRKALRGLDELERRVHLEAAGLALPCAVLAAAAYALFETRLPALSAQWVASGLLLTWWLGWLVATRRYR